MSDAATRTVRWSPPRRWPTAAGIAFAGAAAYGLSDGAELAPVLAASGLLYLGAAALQRRSSAWPLFFASFVLIAATKMVSDALDPTYVLLVAGALLALYGVVTGASQPAWGLPLQAAAMVVIGVAAATAPMVHPDLGGYIVAAGLLGHAGWDAYHHRTGRVVARSLAEFCLVLDILLALAILVVTMAS